MNAWSGEQGGDVMGPTVTRAASAKPNTPPLKNGNDLRESGYLIAVGSRTARFRRKYKKNIPIIIIVLVFFLLLLAFIIITILYAVSIHRKPPILCKSKECLRSAANLALSMDTSADPCEDFYQYACGNWASNHPRPDSLQSYDWFRDKQTKVYTMVRDFLVTNTSNQPKPVQQAKDMFRGCMDTETLDRLGLKPVINILQALGLPPYPTFINATGEFNDSTYSFNWLDTVIKIKTQVGMDVLIGFDIFTDPKNSTVYRLVMGSPETTNPFPSMHNEKKRHGGRRNLENLITFMKSSSKFLYQIERRRSDKEKDADDKDAHIYKLFYAELIKLFVLESEDLKASHLSEVELDQNIIFTAQEYYKMKNEIYELEADNSTESDEDFMNIPEYTVDAIQTHTDGVVENNNGTASPIWKKYLEGIFSISNVELDFEHDKVLVSDLDLKYMSLMAAYVSKTPPALLELYIWVKQIIVPLLGMSYFRNREVKVLVYSYISRFPSLAVYYIILLTYKTNMAGNEVSIKYNVVEVMAAHTTTELQTIFQRANEKIHARDTSSSRSLLCANAVNDLLGMAVSYGIADPYFVNVTKPKILTMIDELKNAFAHLVGKTKWMDDNTKIATYEKIIKMKSLIGFPSWFLEEGKLEEYYNGLEIDSTKHLENMINIIQIRIKKALNRFRDGNNFTWATDPTEVNAYHTFQENTITVPMVMLQHPFFDLGLDSLNYGSLGTVLGHEITHGFDNFGRQFDKNGNMLPWWSNNTIESFVNMTQCFVDQYSSYYLPELDEYINGKNTLGENIADNGGLREALAAFRRHMKKRKPEPKLPGFEHMHPEQLFFLSYGNLWCGVATRESLISDLVDEHSPQQFRARGALQNSEEFAKAWHCRPGSAMNPLKRCIIF